MSETKDNPEKNGTMECHYKRPYLIDCFSLTGLFGNFNEYHSVLLQVFFFKVERNSLSMETKAMK